jgi:hypothetical protein
MLTDWPGRYRSGSVVATRKVAMSKRRSSWAITVASQKAGRAPASSSAALIMTRAMRSNTAFQSAASSGVQPGPFEVRDRGHQAGAHAGVVLGDGAELAVLAPQVLQVRAEGVDVRDVGHDPAQRVHQPVALGSHRKRERIPRLRVPKEQV